STFPPSGTSSRPAPCRGSPSCARTSTSRSSARSEARSSLPVSDRRREVSEDRREQALQRLTLGQAEPRGERGVDSRGGGGVHLKSRRALVREPHDVSTAVRGRPVPLDEPTPLEPRHDAS